MSLVPTWVLAENGKLYECPVLRGEGWFLCFDDDDPPELVFKVEKVSGVVAQDIAKAILKEAGIKGYRMQHNHRSDRLFGDRFHHADSFFVTLNEPIPVPKEFDSVVESYPKGEGVYYLFGREFPDYPKARKSAGR